MTPSLRCPDVTLKNSKEMSSRVCCADRAAAATSRRNYQMIGACQEVVGDHSPGVEGRREESNQLGLAAGFGP